MLRNSALKRVSSCMMKETALQQICSLSPLIHRGCLRDMVDQWRHRGLWQRYWHWSPHTAVEAGWSDSRGSNAEAGHDKSALYFRASGGKEKHPISMPTPTETNPDSVAASALSHELHLKPLLILCVRGPTLPRMNWEFHVSFVSLHILFCFLPVNYCCLAFPALVTGLCFFFAALQFFIAYVCLNSSI